ncbi:hypothetical protein [Epibacterium ulvae]|uniref:hypothetical protein n=1 Tax=Epibacterium ulvae TaxID=1156985 RepID=UPI0024904EC8|nr:hypothetical protein [Epibacterium ulvae]
MTGETSNVDATRSVEVFRAGTFRAMSGQDFSFTADDVAAIANNYDAASAPAPVVIGHPKHDDPAFGWAEGFEVNNEGVLIAHLHNLAPEFVSAVEDGRYRKISMKFFPPDAASNPVPGTYYPRHVGFLGGAAPAVPGLKPVEFSDTGDDELIEVAFSASEFAEPAFEEVAGMFRRVREFFIEKFSREEADQVLPEYMIRWIDSAAKEPENGGADFANPQNEEPNMSGDTTDLAKREAALAKRERALRSSESTAFADGLIGQGKLLPVQKARVVALLNELGGQLETEISFSEGDAEKTADPASLLKEILSATPEIVPQGETDMGDAPGTSNVAFAAPDGLAVDSADLELHQKAAAYQRENPGTAYLDAVAAVGGV